MLNAKTKLCGGQTNLIAILVHEPNFKRDLEIVFIAPLTRLSEFGIKLKLIACIYRINFQTCNMCYNEILDCVHGGGVGRICLL